MMETLKSKRQDVHERTDSALSALKALIERSKVPYKGLPVNITSRMGGALGFVLVGLTLVAAAFESPDGHGMAGWYILIFNVAVWTVGGAMLLGGRWVQGPNQLLASSYGASVQIAALTWATGTVTGSSLYVSLFLIPLVCVAAVHPLNRWLAFFGFTVFLVMSPIFFSSVSSRFLGEAVLFLTLWLGMGFVILLMMSDIRFQRRRLEQEQSEATRLARLDSLTGLGNQRGFWETLSSEIAQAQRTFSPLSLVLADIDHFKRVNDEFGHREGDELLARVGVSLVRTARTSDKCFRYGGEEFVVVLRDVSLVGADSAAERFRTAVSQIQSPGGPVTISCGIAEFTHGMNADSLLRAADEALLEAKRTGRDRTVAYTGIGNKSSDGITSVDS